MTPGTDSRDDPIALDRSLEALLRGRPVGPVALGDQPDATVDPELARAARVVGIALARFHPSFRFEERLAARLRAASLGDEVATDHDRAEAGELIPFAPPGRRRPTRSRRVNGAILGGAISAGVSLASIAAGALVARRRGRGDHRWERVL